MRNGILLRHGAALACGAMLLAGCAGPHALSESVDETVRETLAKAKQASAPEIPREVSAALLPPVEVVLPQGGKAPLEPTFDLAVNNTPARQVYLALVEGTPYSIVLHPEVTGNLTLNLKNVTVPQVMDAIRNVYGYDYRREGKQFFVLSRGIQTRVFAVNYLNLMREGKSNTQVVAGELTQAGTLTNTGGAATVARTGNTSAGIEVQTQSKTDFWTELEATIKGLVGTEGGRRVVANPQTGLLVVRAHPEELRAVEEFLARAKSSINRQVILEAKVIEVELNDAFRTGINWAQLGRDNGRTIVAGQTGGGTVLPDFSGSDIAGNAADINPSLGNLISGTEASAFGGIFSLAIRASHFSAFVEALKTQGKVNVLSSPRVSTVNNQKAVIKVGGDEFFVTGITNTVTSTTSTGVPISSPSVSLTPFFSGIALDVTPAIDGDGNIILHIHPSVSEVTQQTKSFSASGLSFSLPLAASSVQESDNIVRASSGQIIVIGGLMKEGSTDQNASVPLLGDIPVIGNLFKHKRITRIKRELVILLKPTVVNTGELWTDAIHESQERIRNLNEAR